VVWLVRYTYFYPTLIDTWVTLFLVAGLFLVHKESITPHRANVAAIAVLAFVGGFYKETVVLIPISLLFLYRPISRVSKTFPFVQVRNPLQMSWQYWLPVVASAASFVITRSIVTPGESYSCAHGPDADGKPPPTTAVPTGTPGPHPGAVRLAPPGSSVVAAASTGFKAGMFLVWYGGGHRAHQPDDPANGLPDDRLAIENLKDVLVMLRHHLERRAVGQRLFWGDPAE
jgi:hypothetical protein